AAAVGEADDGGAEAAVTRDLAAQPAGERDRVSLDGDVHVEARASEEDVADGAADEVEPLAAGERERPELVGDRVRRGQSRRSRPGRPRADSTPRPSPW